MNVIKDAMSCDKKHIAYGSYNFENLQLYTQSHVVTKM